MTPTEILYEPLPVGRIGVRAGDQKVVIAKDYSCFAALLEEYVAHGALTIAIPKSSPEARSVDEMPLLLRRRIKLINDDKEEETLDRLSSGLRREFCLSISKDSRQLIFPREMDRELQQTLLSVYSNTKRLLFAYNHQLQAEVDIAVATQSYKLIRDKANDPGARALLAHLEGVLRHYEATKYDSFTPKGSTGRQLVDAFDSLANDADYIEYSSSIHALSLPKERDSALLKLEAISRTLSSKKIVGVTWDYLSKVVKVWTGIPLLESKELSVLSSEKPLPTLITMQAARERAVASWLESGANGEPLAREGRFISDEKITWLPPMPSMKVYSPDDAMFSLGTVSQLKDALEKAQTLLEHKDS